MLTYIYLVVAYWFSINAFVHECPHPSQWNIRAKHYCQVATSKYYSCLLNNHTGEYQEICGGRELSQKGSKYILIPNPHQVPCSSNHFQPFKFDSANNSKCVFTKSECNEEGQIVAMNGETFDDRICRCDYTRSYTYVTTPKNKCFCVPSQEDCSCYREACGVREIMTADYRCVSLEKKLLPEDITCPIIVISGGEADTETMPTVTLIDNSLDAFTSKWTFIAILFLLGLIFTTILLILYIKVLPQVKQKVVTSGKDKKLLTGTDDSPFTYEVVEGDSLTIECNISSSLGIKSVFWQKERDGHKSDILKTKEKYTLISTTTTASLTVNNFTSDDDGIYKCIVTNYIGLDNTVGHRCLDFLSGKHRCFNAMLYFPNFNREEKNKIKVSIYNFTYTDLPDIYEMEISCQGNVTVFQVDQRCDTVMIHWLRQIENEEKENPPTRRNLTRIRPEMSGGKYSGGNSENPSLTIHSTNVHDTGRYVCILTPEKGDKIIVGRKLLVIPEEKMYREIVQHLKDQLFVKTSSVDKALQCLVTNGIVIIKGRKGTGKTKMCLELALACGKEGFMPYYIDLTNTTKDFSCNTLYIIDEIKCESNNMDLLKNLFDKKMSRIIITCSDFVLSTFKSLLIKCNLYKKDHVIDLDYALPTDKEKILRSYMAANSITETSAQECNFRDPKILSDDKIVVTLDHEELKAIVRVEPMIGFPLTVVQFCGDRKNLYKGTKFFTDPPRNLVEEIKSAFVKAVTSNTNGACSEEMNECLVLAYIANEPNHVLDINDIDWSKIAMFRAALFHVPDNHSVNLIKHAASKLTGKYLKCENEVYKFTYPCISKAVNLSSDYFVRYLIEFGSLNDIFELCRSFKYENVAKELVLYLNADEKYNYEALCERLFREAAMREAKDFFWYIYHGFIKYRDTVFLSSLFEYLESNNKKTFIQNIPKSESKSPSVKQSLEKQATSQMISPWEMMTLTEHLTLNGKDPWIFHFQSVPVSIFLYGLVVACKNHYMNNIKQKKTIDTIMSLLQSDLENKTVSESFLKRFDKYGNNFLHYLVLYGEEECCYILSYNDDMLLRNIKDLVTLQNYFQISALHLAAYLGKCKIVKKLMMGTKHPKNDGDVLTFVEKGAVEGQSTQQRAPYLYFNEKVVGSLKNETSQSFFELQNWLKSYRK